MSGAAVVTGLGCILPGAPGVAGLRRLLFEPGTAAGTPGGRRVESLAEEAKKLPALVRRRMSRLSTMAGVACLEALDGAGLDAHALPHDIGFVFGTGYGELDTTSRLFTGGLAEGMSPTLFHNSVHNAPLGYAGIVTGIKGPSLTVSDGDISGEAALAWASLMIEGGIAGIFVAGGGDERYEFPLFEDPGQRGDPGEGSAFLALESAAGAHARGRRPLCAVGGWSVDAWRGAPDDRAGRVALLAACIDRAAKGRAVAAVFTPWDGGVDGAAQEAVRLALGAGTPAWSSDSLAGGFPASGAVRACAAALCIAGGRLPAGTRGGAGEGKEVGAILVLSAGLEGDAAAVLLERAEGDGRDEA